MGRAAGGQGGLSADSETAILDGPFAYEPLRTKSRTSRILIAIVFLSMGFSCIALGKVL